MSIGPSNPIPEETKFEKVKIVTAKLAAKFFENPARILFYGGSFTLLIGLFVGMTFNVEYYAVLATFGIISLYQWHINKTPDAK